MERPAGFVVTVTEMGLVPKLPASVIGPFIVTLEGFAAPVNDPAPVPVQPENEKPVLGVAEIGTISPLSKNPVAGEVLPPAAGFIVSWYWVPKVAVYAEFVVGETVCVLVPASLHESYR
jgi:hypothetical protein